MTKFALGQEWVSKVTASECLDIPVTGPGLNSMPSTEELYSVLSELARSGAGREISRRKWIDPKPSSHKEKIIERGKAILEFLKGSNSTILANARFKGQRPKSKMTFINHAATIAWITFVTNAAREISNKVVFKPSSINDDFVHRLVKLSILEDAPRHALDAVRNIGIKVVTEKGLPGMSVDGASFHTKQIGPVIALTLARDRLDNFWFTLLHELGHIALHLSSPSENFFIDSIEEESDALELEAEANAFAKDSLIPRDIWQRSDARRYGSASGASKLAIKLDIHPSITAGRIRYERRNYTILDKLIGRGKVRDLLLED